MGRKKELGKASNGLYFRNLGWKQTSTGYVQQKFYLGRDESKAKLANLRLEQLWQQISGRREREIGSPPASEKNMPGPKLVDVVQAVGRSRQAFSAIVSVGTRHVDAFGDRPVWDKVTLAIADAIRNGEPIAYIPLPRDLAALRPEHPLVWAWLDGLRTDITGIKIELENEIGQRVSEQQIQQHGHRLVEKGRRMLRKAGGQALHAALDAYSKWVEATFVDIETKKVTYWGSTQTRIIDFLKRCLPDYSLEELGARKVDNLLEILKNRPLTEGGKCSSVAWTKSCIKLLRSFLRWLNRAPEFEWRRPADLETTQIRVALTRQEISAKVRSTQVETYNLDEVRILWQYASPFQRLLMLLALNCGAGRAEVASLSTNEVALHQRHPREQEVEYSSTDEDSWVFRIRHKTGVYGEFKLWPETVKAIEWWLRQRASIQISDTVDTLLVTKKGHRYDAPTKGNHPNYQIPNGWYSLTKRIRKDKELHGNFRELSFNKLRKTAGNLIRREADGEIAGVFLCHGTPVRSDELLDLYTNRPFAKLFEALDRLGLKLRPLWASVAEPFPEKRPQGGPNISRGMIQRIQAMRQQGYKLKFIAKKFGIDISTAQRWAKRAELKTDPTGE